MSLSPSRLSDLGLFPLHHRASLVPGWAFLQRIPPEVPDTGCLDHLLSPILAVAPTTFGMRKRYLRVLGVIIHNLYRACLLSRIHGGAIRVAVYRGHASRHPLADPSLRLSRPVQNRILDAMQACGLIHQKRGSFRLLDDGSKHCRPSAYWPSEALAAAFRSMGSLSPHQLGPGAPDRALVTLRNRADKEDLDILDGLDASGVESVRGQGALLRGYNDLLARAGYEVVIPGEVLASDEDLQVAFYHAAVNEDPVVKWAEARGESFRLAFKPRSLSYRRIFTGDLRHGGRIYAGVQSLSCLLRPFTKLGGEEIADLDYSGAHIRLLYQKVGQRPPVELYPFDLSKFSPLQRARFEEAERAGRVTPRGIAKRALLTAINAQSLESAVSSLRQAMAKEWFVYLKEDRDGETTPIETILKDLAAAHAPIARYLFSDAGLECQFIESEIMMRVVAGCTGRGIPVIAMHDGVMAPASKIEEVRRVMVDAWPGGDALEGLVKVKELGMRAATAAAPPTTPQVQPDALGQVEIAPEGPMRQIDASGAIGGCGGRL